MGTLEYKAFVYMLRCADGSFYTGWTTDVERRLKAHNGEIYGGAKYTKTRRPVQLILNIACLDKVWATKLEWHIKRFSRIKKEQLLTDRHKIVEKIKLDILKKQQNSSLIMEDKNEGVYAFKILL